MKLMPGIPMSVDSETDTPEPNLHGPKLGKVGFRCICGTKCTNAMALLTHTQTYHCVEIIDGL